MSAVVSPIFTGCAAALVTPFSPDSRIDEQALRRLISFQMEAGMDAIVLLGTTGEPSTLTMIERERIIRIGAEIIGKRIPLIIGTGSNSTTQSMEYAVQAHELGADAQLCVTPYYNKATQNGLIRHYSAIMDAAPLPMIAYNVPGRTGMTISADTIAALSVHPNFCGVKEASGDPMLTAEIRSRTGGTIPVYAGNDELITPLMALGAAGAISVCANIIPAQTRALTAACISGQFTESTEIQLALTPLIRALFYQTNPIPVKAALSMMGMISDTLRLPLTPMEEPFRSQLRSILRRHGLIKEDAT